MRHLAASYHDHQKILIKKFDETNIMQAIMSQSNIQVGKKQYLENETEPMSRIKYKRDYSGRSSMHACYDLDYIKELDKEPGEVIINLH